MKPGTVIFLLLGLALIGIAAWNLYGSKEDKAIAPGTVDGNGTFRPTFTGEQTVETNGTIIGGTAGLFTPNGTFTRPAEATPTRN